jgi:hypothetical protein
VGALAKFSALKARCGARLPGGRKGERPDHDPLSWRCRARRGLTRHSFDERHLRPAPRSSVPAQAAFRLDFGGWLARLTERDRAIIRDLAAGELPFDAARRHHLSPASISRLRDAWRQSCQRFGRR